MFVMVLLRLSCSRSGGVVPEIPDEGIFNRTDARWFLVPGCRCSSSDESQRRGCALLVDKIQSVFASVCRITRGMNEYPVISRMKSEVDRSLRKNDVLTKKVVMLFPCSGSPRLIHPVSSDSHHLESESF